MPVVIIPNIVAGNITSLSPDPLSTTTCLAIGHASGAPWRSIAVFDAQHVPPSYIIDNVMFYMVRDYVQGTLGNVDVQRILRNDMEPSQANWTRYKTGSNWTTAGAAGLASDITDDPTVVWDGLLKPGNYAYFDITPLFRAGLNSSDGKLRIRLKAQTETPDVFGQYYNSAALYVTYHKPRLYFF